ncbi:MAG: aminotransferase class III-fold pyridoxal phosphate-dependent enzyme [Bacteroidetes bacterium]|nr:aminotransferase class III-fold pyridoxal phosphate-dependent enzyme [Bacteroidota bacterium]
MTLFDVYPLFPIDIQRSHGCHVYDQHGRRYLDFYGGHAVISVGHSHPHFLKRVKDQMDKIAFYSNFVENELREVLAAKLGELSGYADYQLFMVNSGAEAIENAMKLASFQNGRTKVVAFGKGFHGRTAAAVNITDDTSIQAPITHGFEVDYLPLNDLEAVKKSLSGGDVCAVVVEGIQGIGGINVPTKEFLQGLQTACEAHGTILILDEIQSGYGRSGKFFAHQYAGIRPDLITVAKGMGNGFPIGGVIISPKFKSRHGLIGTTFGGTHMACAAALGVLEIIENEHLIENAAKQGERLFAELNGLEGIKEIRGKGLMIGVELEFPAAPFRKKLMEEFGVFTGSSSNKNTVRLLPPLSVNDAEVEEFLGAFKACLEAISVAV